MGGADIDLGLAGKRALVTGAGAGAGRAIAVWLARAECDVAVIDIDGAAAEQTAVLVRDAGRASVAVVADVRLESAVGGMIEQVRAGLGGLDVAVNNVGMLGGRHAQSFLEADGDHVRAIIEQNLVSTALCCRAEALLMIEQGGGGSIINVSSGESLRPSPQLAAYGAAKAAVNHLTRTLAYELGPHGIRVNVMAPGTMLTAAVRQALSDEYVETLRQSIPLRRMTEPDDLGRTAVYLASDLARHVTGQFLIADGGADLSRSRPSRR